MPKMDKREKDRITYKQVPHLESPEIRHNKYSKATLFTKSKGFIFLALCTATALFGSSFLMGICTPLAYNKYTIKLHRSLADRVLGGWFLFTVSLMELVLNMKIKVTGDNIKRGENTIYILNHRTRFDWMWAWPLFYHYARLRKLKIVLKAPLKWAPGFGWACMQGVFLFLKRIWQKDKKYMEDTFEYFEYVEEPIELLVFPEGTDYTPEGCRSSIRFAEKNNLREYEYLLHPRTTGFEFMVKQLKQSKQINYICDLTIAYPMNLLQNEIDLMKFGNFPQETHIHVEKFKVEDLPSNYSCEDLKIENSLDNETIGDWLTNRFYLKENRLKKFYSDTPENRKFSSQESKSTYNPRTLGLYLSLVLWPLFTSIWIYYLFVNRTIFWFQIFMMLFYVFELLFFGGFDAHLVQLGLWMKGRAKKNK